VTVGEPHTIDVPLAHAGRSIAELEVEPARDELALENNVAVAEIDVVREHLRVLLVSGEPHAGERTWRNVLKSDAAVDLVHFTILRPPEKQDGTPINELSLIAFPTRELFEEKIDQFDLIIFDRYQSRGVLPIVYYDNLARYVRDGGAILVASGPDYASSGSLYRTPLGPVLPAVPTGEIIEQPYRAQISPVGMRHPVTRDLPGASSNPGLELVVPLGRRRRHCRRHHHDRAERPAAPGARARGQRPRRDAPFRPGVAVGARLPGWRPACPAAETPAALADEGAGARGRGADRACGWPQSRRRTADAFRDGAARQRHRPERQARGAEARAGRARALARRDRGRAAGDCTAPRTGR
jgi:hypothetical protein